MDMDLFIEIFVSWFPMIVLIGVWIFFIRRMKSPQKQTIVYLEKQNDLIAKQVEISERIALALEKISEKNVKQGSV